MALAFLFAGLAVARQSRLDCAARWAFFGGFGLVVGFLAWYSAAYGFHPEYRLEVAALSVDWLVLIVVGFVLALAWRRKTARAAVVHHGDD